MKIVVIGAGHGGLQAAATLANGGNEVAVYEQSSRESVSYDWVDNAEKKVFAELGITLPQGSCYDAGSSALVAPFSDKPLKVESNGESNDWTVERRVLVQILADNAEKAGAKVNFGSAVDSLIIENERVVGIVVGGNRITADLVIDSSGALSPFRASLPKSFGITAQPKPHEVFKVYRAFFEQAQGIPFPSDFPQKVYLKHIGEMGISWCLVEPDGSVNVLVGRTGELSDETLRRGLAALRKDNPIIGNRVLRGGQICTIPIRYPLTRMAGNGYAAVGDAAFMTIPMIGSGIANSLRAGQMLAQTVLAENSVSVETLWHWQAKYYREIGAGHVCVDVIKRMLLNTPAGDIRYLFDNGVIDENDMASISSGAAMVMTPAKIIKKIIRGRKKLGVLLKLKAAIANGEKAEALAKEIPQEFNEQAVREWQKKIDSVFGN